MPELTRGALRLAWVLVACGPERAEPADDSGTTTPSFSCGDPDACEVSSDCPAEAPFCAFDNNQPAQCCMADACGEGGAEDLCHCRKVCIAECVASGSSFGCRDDEGCCDGHTCADATELHGGLCVP